MRYCYMPYYVYLLTTNVVKVKLSLLCFYTSQMHYIKEFGIQVIQDVNNSVMHTLH